MKIFRARRSSLLNGNVVGTTFHDRSRTVVPISVVVAGEAKN